MVKRTITIIGMGRIGRVVASRAEARGFTVAPVTRRGGEPAGDGPILLSVGEDDVAPAAGRLKPSVAPRMVFVQNGLVQEIMERYPGAGRGLLHFNADHEGNVRVLDTSIFGGEAGKTVAEILDAGGVPSRYEPDPAHLRVEEIRKLMWSAVLSALAYARRVTVGELAETRGDEMDALARESIAIAAAALEVEPDVAELLAWLRTMAAALPDYKGSRRGQTFRSQMLVRMGRRLGLPTARNEALLRDLDYDV